MRRLQIQTFIDLIFHRYRWEPIITSGLLPLFPSRPPLLCQVLNVVGDPQPSLLFLRPTRLLPHSPRRAILEVVSWPRVIFYWIECDVCGASYFLCELKTPLSLCEPIRHDCNSSQRFHFDGLRGLENLWNTPYALSLLPGVMRCMTRADPNC